MTGAAWQATRNPRALIDHLQRIHLKPPIRSLRLYLCACSRLPGTPTKQLGEAVALIEEMVDGTATLDALNVFRGSLSPGRPATAAERLCRCVVAANARLWDAAKAAGNLAVRLRVQSLVGVTDGPVADAAWVGHEQPERVRLCELIHDLFGNPFESAVIDPAWRTSTVTAIARGVYESRDFSALPILADALQDAGCDNEDVLNHCRGNGPHIRGCWVLDLLTGRT